MIKDSDIATVTHKDDKKTAVMIATKGHEHSKQVRREILYCQRMMIDLGNYIKAIEDVDDDTIRTQAMILKTLKYIKKKRSDEID